MPQSKRMHSFKRSQTQALSVFCLHYPPGLWGHQLTDSGRNLVDLLHGLGLTIAHSTPPTSH